MKEIWLLLFITVTVLVSTENSCQRFICLSSIWMTKVPQGLSIANVAFCTRCLPVLWSFFSAGDGKWIFEVGGRVDHGLNYTLSPIKLSNLLLFLEAAGQQCKTLGLHLLAAATWQHMACRQMRVHGQPRLALHACQLFAESAWHQMVLDT